MYTEYELYRLVQARQISGIVTMIPTMNRLAEGETDRTGGFRL
jgi:hypothetical protein